MTDIASLQQQAERAFKAGNMPAAIQAARSVLALAPNHTPAHLLLSHAAMLGQQFRLATRDVLRAIAGLPEQAPTMTAAVALRLITIGEYGAANRLIRYLDLEQPLPDTLLFDLAQQATLLDQHELALRLLDLATRRSGENHAMAYFRGNAMKFMGRMDEAAQAFERAIALEPAHAHSHWALAFLGRKQGASLRAARLRTLLARSGVNDGDRAYLGYALYRELEALEDSDGAWTALSQAAAAKRRTLQHDVAAETALFDQIIATFTAEFVHDAAEPAADAPTPIFIVGMPRTGTTLLERILGNHDQVSLCGELNDLRMQYKWVTDYYCPGFFDAKSLARASTAKLTDVGTRYLDHVHWRAPGARFFTDKNPGNFQLIGLILKALPQAKIIHLSRDPTDACFSNFKELFAANAYSYSYDLTELAAHHRNYARLMAHWHVIAPGRVLDVRYEDLVTAPEAQTRRVMKYLGLNYAPDQVRIEDSTEIVSTASSAQVREPIHSRNVGGWQRYATQLAPLLTALRSA